MDTGDATGVERVGSGMKKERSPSFPFIGLSRAIERARAVYAQARRHELRVADAATAWGLGVKSSSTLQTIAALLAYGLLEDQGSGDARKIKITELAFKALEDQRPGEREAALAEAAAKPKLIAEYVEKWKEGRPADNICISELRIDRGFTEDGANAFLRVYDDTIQYVGGPAIGEAGDKDDSPPSPVVKVGDVVQWTNAGADQLNPPLPVVAISEDGSWVQVAGSATGIPVNEIKVLGSVGTPKAPAQSAAQSTIAPGVPQFLNSNSIPHHFGQTANHREEKFALSEGDVVIRFPSDLSADSVEDLDAYLQIFLKRVRREAAAKTAARRTPGADVA